MSIPWRNNASLGSRPAKGVGLRTYDQGRGDGILEIVADVDVLGAGEGNADAPGLLGGIVAEALFEEGVIETQGEVA